MGFPNGLDEKILPVASILTGCIDDTDNEFEKLFDFIFFACMGFPNGFDEKLLLVATILTGSIDETDNEFEKLFDFIFFTCMGLGLEYVASNVIG
jgi:hypothetical protein